MAEIFELCSTPSEEQCAQVGSKNYRRNALLECEAMIAQFRRKFGPEPAGVRFRPKSNPHDFGTYYDVCLEFNGESDEAIEYAYNVEANTPENWDKKSLQFLKDNGYKLDD